MTTELLVNEGPGPFLKWSVTSPAGLVLAKFTFEQDARLFARPVSASTLPPEVVEALPPEVRRYAMWLETEADPAGTVRRNYALTLENEGLRALIAERRAEVEAPVVQPQLEGAESWPDDLDLAEEGLAYWDAIGDDGDKLWVAAVRRCLARARPLPEPLRQVLAAVDAEAGVWVDVSMAIRATVDGYLVDGWHAARVE